MGIVKRYTDEEVESILNLYSLQNLDKKYINIDSKMNIVDSFGYKYYISLYEIKKLNGRLKALIKHNPYIIHNIKLWLQLNDKKSNLISDKYENTKSIMEWECLACGLTFERTLSEIKINRECQHCKKVEYKNSIECNYPEISMMWDIDKNNQSPKEIDYRSKSSYYWRCEKGHEFKRKLQGMIEFKDCVKCTKQNNILSNKFPDVLKDWDYSKNKINPREISYGSSRYIWWKCHRCKYEWRTRLSSRVCKGGTDCPVCGMSKGERRIVNYLIDKGNSYIFEKKFDGLVGLKGVSLSYDFYLPNENILIEYQGEFHDGSSGKYTQINLSSQIEHDERKRAYAKDNNIKLIEIWYWDRDNIEKILEESLNG